jgi:superfamily II DNA or RNA helicase
LQRIGRVIRKYTYPDGRKKNDAYVYDLHDHLKYLSMHAAARKRIYRTEPQFDIREFKI